MFIFLSKPHFFPAQKMVTVMPDSDDQQIDRTSNDDNTEDQENKIEHEVRYIKPMDMTTITYMVY